MVPCRAFGDFGAVRHGRAQQHPGSAEAGAHLSGSESIKRALSTPG